MKPSCGINVFLSLFSVSVVTSSCANNPCMNGGTCTENNNGQSECTCSPGFSGTLCQIRKYLYFNMFEYFDKFHHGQQSIHFRRCKCKCFTISLVVYTIPISLGKIPKSFSTISMMLFGYRNNEL